MLIAVARSRGARNSVLRQPAGGDEREQLRELLRKALVSLHERGNPAAARAASA